MASQRDAKKAQQDFFSNMQTAFLGEGNSGQGIIGQLKSAADDLRAASDMLKQNTQATPTYGGPNGGRPTFNGNGTVRPGQNHDYSGGYAGYNGIRGSIANQVASRVGSSGSAVSRGMTYSEVYGDDGTVIGYEEYNQSGHKTGVRHAAGTPQGKAAAQTMQRQQAAGGLHSAISNGQVFTQGANGEVHTPGIAALQHVAKSIPLVGGLVAGLIGAPDAALNAVVNNRAKNAQYQAILGGTNWGTGSHNRRLAEGFKLSQLYSGGLTGAMSEEAFNGVTGLGYTGDNRNQSLNLITSNYKNLGMSVGESLQFVSTMAKTSSTNFEELKTALNNVSKEAKATGQNLELARKNLSNLFDISSQTIGGPGSLGVASSIATYQAGQGRNFANVDYSQMIPGRNLGITGMMANTLGMDIGTYELQQAGGGTKAKLQFDKAADMQSALSVSTAVADPNVVSVINQLAQKYGGKQKVLASNSALQNFVQFCIRDNQFQSIVGHYILIIQASTNAYTGAQMNAEQIAENIIRQVLGANASYTTMDKKQQQSMLQTNTSTTTKSEHELNMEGIYKDKNGKWMQSSMSGPVDVTNKVTKRGHNDPLLDKFKAQYANGSVHLKVKTAKGDMVVSGTYAAQHLQDQIATGAAVFMDGQYAGQSVADALGGGFGESNYYKNGGQNTTGGKVNSHFTGVDKFNAKAGNGGGTVTIAPNPALAQLLQFSATGNINIANQGAIVGLPPSPGQTGVTTN